MLYPISIRLTGILTRTLPVLAALALLAGAAQAADPYPNRPVRIIVPFAAAGSGDAVTRIVAQRLTARLGQTFIVENRAGAGGAIGEAATAASTPDGYTIGFVSSGHAWIGALNPNLPFNPSRDLTPIALICSTPYVVLARNNAPFKTVQEFIAYAKANPGKASIGSAGVGTLTHLLPAWLMAETGSQWIHVPFNGTAPAMNALLGGTVDIIFDPIATSLPQIQANKAKLLATTGATRARVLPNTPTLADLGYLARGATWFGLMAPTGVPRPIIERLNQEVNAILEEPEVKQRLEALNFTIEAGSIQHFGEFIEAQTKAWAKIVKDNNIKGD